MCTCGTYLFIITIYHYTVYKLEKKKKDSPCNKALKQNSIIENKNKIHKALEQKKNMLKADFLETNSTALEFFKITILPWSYRPASGIEAPAMKKRVSFSNV